MNILITGGCGFLGSNLAKYAIDNGYKLTIFDNLSRVGSMENLEWLKSLGKECLKFIHGDVRNQNDIECTLGSGFDAVFHLAGQVAMTTSIENPRKDFEINALGTLNILEGVRKYCPDAAVFYSSTNKVYGDLNQFSYKEGETRYYCNEYPQGFSEEIPLNFSSPYGCSKGCGDQYLLDYHHTFGLKTVIFRHSSMYGSRQFATYDQGWVGWFCSKALEKRTNINSAKFTISGNGKQVRDILHADDMVSLYFTALKNIDSISGNTFNIGGSMSQSLSLLELFNILENELNIRLEYDVLPMRLSDQLVFVADITKINKMTGWTPKVSKIVGIESMLKWVAK